MKIKLVKRCYLSPYKQTFKEDFASLTGPRQSKTEIFLTIVMEQVFLLF